MRPDIGALLWNQVENAAFAYDLARASARTMVSGLPRGSDRNTRLATDAYVAAMHEFNQFVMYGDIPERLRTYDMSGRGVSGVRLPKWAG
jgi:hypothetical protein